MADSQAVVHSLMLPLERSWLLLPQTAVAEVVRHPNLTELEESSGCVQGFLEWRAQQVPVISFEVLSGGSAVGTTEPELRVAVVYALEGLPKLAFYAIAIRGLPRPVRAERGNLVPDAASASAGKAVACRAQIDAQPVLIPNLKQTERLIFEQLKHCQAGAAHKEERA